MKSRQTAILILMATTGCTDLSAVQEFAKSSNAITTSDPVIAGWPRIYAEAERLAASPQVKARAPDLQDKLRQEAADANADAPLALEAGKALGLYMQVLGALAADNLPDVSSQASSISSSLSTLGVVNSSAKNAAAALIKVITIPLDAWRRVAIRDLILNSNDDVQTISDYLATTANAVEKGNKFVARVTDQYWEASGALSGDRAIQALTLREERNDDATFATSIAQAQAAQAAFRKIAADHATLAKHANSLSSAQVRNTLSNDLPVLLAALQLFERK